MSGGVDSSVAAALLAQEGHEIEGATLKLWGGASDSGCCSVSDVDDARRVAQRLGITHHVFNMAEEFDEKVVNPYVLAHEQGRTPNPCIECNRSIKFSALIEKAKRLGFDALATGHYAQVSKENGRYVLSRGVDPRKDQSYVLSMLGQDQLRYLLLPIGSINKATVREQAVALNLITAKKPDSQDVCFIESTKGRMGFLESRLTMHPGTVVDAQSGAVLGEVPAVELVTIGQRKGLPAAGRRHYVVDVNLSKKVVAVAPSERAVVDEVLLTASSLTWTDQPLRGGEKIFAQVSAHGRPRLGQFVVEESVSVRFDRPDSPVAPGQTIGFYSYSEPSRVVGSGIVTKAVVL
jgi:tRNA-specific 2-thiouridylase